MSNGTTGAACERQTKLLSKKCSPPGSDLPEKQTLHTRTDPAAQIVSPSLPTTTACFPKEHKLTLSENVLRLSCSSGTELPLLPFLLCCLENCCSETDRWCLCHSRRSLRYLCQLIFPPCLAVACETGPHRSNLINGVPSLRLVLAPPSSSKRKKMKTHSWIFSSFLLLFFFF